MKPLTKEEIAGKLLQSLDHCDRHELLQYARNYWRPKYNAMSLKKLQIEYEAIFDKKPITQED